MFEPQPPFTPNFGLAGPRPGMRPNALELLRASPTNPNSPLNAMPAPPPSGQVPRLPWGQVLPPGPSMMQPVVQGPASPRQTYTLAQLLAPMAPGGPIAPNAAMSPGPAMSPLMSPFGNAMLRRGRLSSNIEDRRGEFRGQRFSPFDPGDLGDYTFAPPPGVDILPYGDPEGQFNRSQEQQPAPGPSSFFFPFGGSR